MAGNTPDKDTKTKGNRGFEVTTRPAVRVRVAPVYVTTHFGIFDEQARPISVEP